MDPRKTLTRFALAGLVAAMLHGCGGSGGGDAAARTSPDRSQVSVPAPVVASPAPAPQPQPDDTPPPAPAPAPAPEPDPVPAATGGFVEDSVTASARGRLPTADILDFLPSRGAFTFPAPYGTRGVRITNESDCDGQDCVYPVGYSYWRNTNNHVHDDEMLIFLSLNRTRGGGGPTLFRYNKVTEELTKDGPLFDASSRFANASGEGWYFSATLPNMLYIRDDAKLVRYDVVSRSFDTVFDATTEFGDGHYIWQMHSSDDDRVHSATLRRSSDYAELGCIVYFEDSRSFRFFAKQGAYDECQVDKSGDWLVIKENVDGRNSSDNRIIDLNSGEERVLADEDGGGGHSDMGHGMMIAADNWSTPNAWRRWDFTAADLDGTTVYRNDHFAAMAPAHVSFAHARPDVPLEQQYVCGASASSKTAVHANEVICFVLDGADNDTLVVAPVMTDQGASGGGDGYSRMPKGNLDVTGQYYVWTSNMGGDRVDAFIVRVPAHKLQ